MNLNKKNAALALAKEIIAAAQDLEAAVVGYGNEAGAGMGMYDAFVNLCDLTNAFDHIGASIHRKSIKKDIEARLNETMEPLTADIKALREEVEALTRATRP